MSMNSYDRSVTQGQVMNYEVKSITSDREKVRLGAVKSRDGKVKELLMPTYQASVNRSCNTITLTPPPPSNSLVGAQNIYQYLLQPGPVSEKFDIIRLTMQASASSVVMSPL